MGSYKCECKCTFKTKQSLERHKKSCKSGANSKTNKKMFKCSNPKCKSEFSKADNLKSHMKTCKYNKNKRNKRKNNDSEESVCDSVTTNPNRSPRSSGSSQNEKGPLIRCMTHPHDQYDIKSYHCSFVNEQGITININVYVIGGDGRESQLIPKLMEKIRPKGGNHKPKIEDSD